MSHVFVASDDNTVWVEVTTDDDGVHSAGCRCGWEGTCRPSDPIGDWLQEAEIHVDIHH